MNQSALGRPAWNPVAILVMVLGFIAFWPIGLAVLAYILLQQKFNLPTKFRSPDAFAQCFRSRGRDFRSSFKTTGNVAFDEWRKAELDRLEKERDNLEQMRRDFDSHMYELRRARDREEFDRFMRERNGRDSSRSADDGFSAA